MDCKTAKLKSFILPKKKDMSTSGFNEFSPFDPSATIMLKNSYRNRLSINHMNLEGRDPLGEGRFPRVRHDASQLFSPSDHHNHSMDTEGHGGRHQHNNHGILSDDFYHSEAKYSNRHKESMSTHLTGARGSGGNHLPMTIHPTDIFDECSLYAGNVYNQKSRMDTHHIFMTGEHY